jgi:hypothetical protein
MAPPRAKHRKRGSTGRPVLLPYDFRQGSSVVEHWSEKPGVESSILSLAISFFADVESSLMKFLIMPIVKDPVLQKVAEVRQE